MPTAKPHPQFARLAKELSSIPRGQAEKKFKLRPYTDDISFEDIFGDPPEIVWVAKGPVRVKGDAKIATAAKAGIYVIDGDLDVDGVLDCTQTGGGSVLFVTGDVQAKALGLFQEFQLWIEGDLTVDGLVIEDLGDAGGLFVRGVMNARGVIEAGRTSGRRVKRLKAPILEKAALAQPFVDDDPLDARAMFDALKKGKPVLASDAPRPSAKSKARAPTTKPVQALAKVAELRAVTLDAADKAFGLRRILETTCCNRPKAVFVHEGPLAVKGNLTLTEPPPDYKFAAYVIDGDLTVGNTLEVATSFAIFVVTGKVKAKSVGVLSQGRLWVGGDLEVAEFVLPHEHLYVQGNARMNVLVWHGGFPKFEKFPTIGTFVSRNTYALSAYDSKWHEKLSKYEQQERVFVPDHARSNMDVLAKHVREGKPLLRA